LRLRAQSGSLKAQKVFWQQARFYDEERKAALEREEHLRMWHELSKARAALQSGPQADRSTLLVGSSARLHAWAKCTWSKY